ncbi:MAG: hypothetical protein ACRD3O_15410 [Terriglobia bacterium]
MDADEERDMPEERAGEADVLGYFLRNPQASDDLEGVARWRLPSEVIHRSVEETSLALERLVQDGFLLKLASLGSEPRFCLNWKKRQEAEALLARMLKRR